MLTTKIQIFSFIIFAALISHSFEIKADSRTTSGNISNSDYAHEHFPECKGSIDVEDIVNSAAAISSYFGYADAGVIALGGQVFSEVRRHGGELSKLFASLSGGSRSECISLCVKPPAGKTVNYARFYMDGSTCGNYDKYKVGGWGKWVDCSVGWSGWREFRVGPYGACGVAANWKHDLSRTAKIVLNYD